MSEKVGSNSEFGPGGKQEQKKAQFKEVLERFATLTLMIQGASGASHSRLSEYASDRESAARANIPRMVDEHNSISARLQQEYGLEWNEVLHFRSELEECLLNGENTAEKERALVEEVLQKKFSG